MFAVALAATAAAITIPKVTYTDTRLKNGLRVIISPDRAAPVVSVAVAYNVGSRNERKGRTGFAHLFEHLMFKGSENVADGELAGLIENYGGSHNGQTDKDHTIYFEQVPSNQLDMVLFLEADRMRAPAITQENVDNQREAVKEERRLRVDNQPYGTHVGSDRRAAFENFANEHSIIGSMADLDAASLEDFADFFKTYYAPNNAVLAIAGDVDAKVALEKVRKYFESIPSGPPRADARHDGARAEGGAPTRSSRIRSRVCTLVDVAYQIPGGINPDMDALSALASVLGSGRSSRLYDSLVRQQQVAVQAGAGVQQRKGPTFFYLEGDGRRPERILPRWRRRSTPRSRKSRRGQFRNGSSTRRATPRGAAWSATCAARCSARFCSRATPCSSTTPRSSTRATSASRR